MRVGSLFAGVGGFDRGLEIAGHTISWQVEINAFANRVLERRWPRTPRGVDVREWTGHGHEHIDLLCGGFPCQDLSVAGERGGLAGARSGLFSEIIRIAQILKPTWGFFENVPGLFSSHAGRDMATVLEGLRECWPVVGYRVLDSRYFYLAQRRERVFFVCGPTERGVEEVLFESEGSGGNLAASGEARTDVAACLRSRAASPGINPPGRGGEEDMNIVCALTSHDGKGVDRGDSSANSKLVVAGTIKNRMRGCTDEVMDNLQVCQSITNLGPGGPDDNEEQAGHLVTHALTANGFDASEDGTGRGTPIIPIAEIGAKTQMGDGRNGCGIGQPGDPMFTLQAGKQHGVGVRRLTPTECERLQGFPDGWTCLCQPVETYNANACTCPDGHRYQAMGNAVSVPVIEWIGRRLMEVERHGSTQHH